MVAGACLVKIWSDFFGWKISHFWSVLESLSFVWLSLLSSTRLNHVVSGSERESSQKHDGKKFKWAPGRADGHEKNWKFWNKCDITMWCIKFVTLNAWHLWRATLFQKLDFRSLVDVKICSGPALRAIFKILAEPRACLTRGGWWCWCLYLLRWILILKRELAFTRFELI